ncbi:MAG TPA: hypothetical protein VHB21_22965 [Minicystis sp.]|nr:hypothetical protein [Minicystis sp.]
MRTLLILAAALSSIALAGCVAPLQSPQDYDGSWDGAWTLDDGSASGGVDMSLHASGRTVTGTVTLSGSICVASGDFAGTVDAGGISGSFSNGFGTVELDGEVDASDHFQGSFHVVGGLCAGARGTFDMHH